MINDEKKIWMHPPRDNYFRILELNAFPYFIENEKKWRYIVTFGEEWGNEKWLQWKGYKTTLTNYEKEDKFFTYRLDNKDILCYKIQATTMIYDTGTTKSTFLYSPEYGFVFMRFETINGKYLEFNLVKTIYDSNSK